MDRKLFLIGLLFGNLFLVLSIFTYRNETDELVLYYSEECPQCEEVLKYFLSVNIPRRLITKEVFYNEENYDEYETLAKRLRIDTLSVPALYDPRKGRLLVGNKEVIQYITKMLRK